MCLRFASLERKLGEIDRARAIFAHASQFCDPRVDKNFWAEWNTFEIETGSEDTYREMLRIRRSVQAQFNTEASYLAAQTVAARQGTKIDGEPIAGEPIDAMAAAEEAGPKTNGFVAATTTALPKPDHGEAATPANGNAGNAEEIQIDDDDDL
jgi:pre-mRNA-splicing factor SYF1